MVTLREVQFLAPLMTVDNEVRETLLEIEEAGDGYVFEVRSKRVMESVWEISDSSGGGSWQKHAAGHLITERDSAGEGETALIDLEAIKARCPDIRDLDSKEEGSEEEGMVYFGPRWRNWKRFGSARMKDCCCWNWRNPMLGKRRGTGCIRRFWIRRRLSLIRILTPAVHISRYPTKPCAGKDLYRAGFTATAVSWKTVKRLPVRC